MKQPTARTAPRVGVLNVLVVVLSVYVLAALLISTVFRLPPETQRLLGWADNAVCVFFLVEFCIRFYYAPSKLHFLRWGWVDLISSVHPA